MSSIVVRAAVEADVPAITAIYAHYVENESASFEIEPPDAAEINRRRADVQDRGLPYLVAELDHVVSAMPMLPPIVRVSPTGSLSRIQSTSIPGGQGRALAAR